MLDEWRKAAWWFRYNLKNRLAGSCTHVETPCRMIALTFDDGPNPDCTPALLELLAGFDAKASFFVVGQQAARYPQIISDIKNAGHTLGCHSWDHTSFRAIGQLQRYRQIKRWEAVLGKSRPGFFRPPFGHQTPASHLLLRAMGYRTVLWNGIAQDWRDDSADVLRKNVAKALQPGSILLFHDNLYHTLDDRYLNRQATLDAVRLLLEEYRSEYQFVSLGELFRSPGKIRNKLVFGKPPPEFMQNLHASPYT